MIAMSAGGTCLHGSTGLASGVCIKRAIVEGQGPEASLGFNPLEASGGQLAGTPALDEACTGRFGG